MNGDGSVIPFGKEPPPQAPAVLPQSPVSQKRRAGTKGRRSTSDRFRLLNNFVDVNMKNVSSSAAAIWLILYRDSYEGIARTSVEQMAKVAGCSKRTVMRATEELIECGVLELVRRGRLGAGTNVYRVRSGDVATAVAG